MQVLKTQEEITKQKPMRELWIITAIREDCHTFLLHSSGPERLTTTINEEKIYTYLVLKICVSECEVQVD